MKPSEKLNKWMSRPMGDASPLPAALAMITALSFTAWVRLDSDSYYMIAQGRDILKNGIPYENAFTYYKNAATVVQQWPYCILEYLASLVPHNIGLWLFMMVQAIALYLLMRRILARHTPDAWVSTIMAAVISAVPVMPYFYSCRPENLTLFILLLEALALEKYKGTKKARFLAALPFLMLIEINFHGSMWPFHFCILAAYLVPPAFKKHMKDNHVKLDKNIIIAAISMLPVMLLNPYRVDMPLYIIKSMPVFDYVPIVEQGSTGVASPYGLQVIACAALLVIMLAHKKISSVNAYMAAGFLALASMQYHSCMFLPLVYLYLLRDALDWFEGLGPARINGIAPNALNILWKSLAVISIILFVPIGIKNLPNVNVNPKMDDAVNYVAEHQKPGENVLNMLDTGSVMDYKGIRGIQTDTRPELMLKSINKAIDAHLEYHWFYNGVRPEGGRPEYKSLGAYMDYHNIQYIVDQTESPAFRYLAGWLSDNPDWELADLGETDERCTFGVWVRAGRQD